MCSIIAIFNYSGGSGDSLPRPSGCRANAGAPGADAERVRHERDITRDDGEAGGRSPRRRRRREGGGVQGHGGGAHGARRRLQHRRLYPGAGEIRSSRRRGEDEEAAHALRQLPYRDR